MNPQSILLNFFPSVYNESRVMDSRVVYFPVSVYVFFVTASLFYLRRISYSRSSSGSTLSVHPAVFRCIMNNLTANIMTKQNQSHVLIPNGTRVLCETQSLSQAFMVESGPEVIKLLSCSTQLSTKFQPLIKLKY